MDSVDLTPTQYGTGVHYPHCINRRCTGCLPPLPAWIEEPDPVVKSDGDGQPIRAGQVGNRAQRRAAKKAGGRS